MMSLLFFNLLWINEWNVMKGKAYHFIMVFSKASKLCHWFLGPKLEDEDFCSTKKHRVIWTHSTLHKNFCRNVKCWGTLEWRLGFCFNKGLCLWLKEITFRIDLVGKRSINLHFSPFPCDLFSWSLPDHKMAGLFRLFHTSGRQDSKLGTGPSTKSGEKKQGWFEHEISTNCMGNMEAKKTCGKDTAPKKFRGGWD